ncbi:hypothetical protein [Herbaspirillum chlorophenolicum]|uniref:hypothetical protein n=1 Tax=Herbaspirillum chlorophenolicum TaxID=211589 RepID=UPI0012E316A6|nr:hypothetical protein [Herbaspirillum chlorophenolicum]
MENTLCFASLLAETGCRHAVGLRDESPFSHALSMCSKALRLTLRCAIFAHHATRKNLTANMEKRRSNGAFGLPSSRARFAGLLRHPYARASLALVIAGIVPDGGLLVRV